MKKSSKSSLKSLLIYLSCIKTKLAIHFLKHFSTWRIGGLALKGLMIPLSEEGKSHIHSEGITSNLGHGCCTQNSHVDNCDVDVGWSKRFPQLSGFVHFIKIGNALILERKICENALVLEDLYPTVTQREINKAKLYKTYFSLNVLRCKNKAF